jgi:hypothetical protein
MLYIPGSVEADSPAARIFAQLQRRFPVVHDDYRKAFHDDAEWPMWLIDNLGLSKVPRMITPQVEPRPQPTLTSEIHGNQMTTKKFELENFTFSDDSELSDDEARHFQDIRNNNALHQVGSELEVVFSRGDQAQPSRT